MRIVSAGILLYRAQSELEVLIVHPGGPYYRNKDDGHWTIPKGEALEGESREETALRETSEELGIAISGELMPLGEVRLKSGKTIFGFALRAPDNLIVPEHPEGNKFELEWPPHSGKTALFPEIDRAQFLSVAAAREKLKREQIPFVDRLLELLAERQPVAAK